MPASLKHLTSKRINYYSLLARWKDGLYYTAALLKCDKSRKRCLVCFEDGSEIWANNRDLHVQLTLDQLSEDEDIVCCICDDGNSELPNYIILCDVCQQGYHQKCHNPPVDSSKIDASDDSSDHKDWICATCSYILRQKDRAKLDATVQQQQQEKQKQQQQNQQTQVKQKQQTQIEQSESQQQQPPPQSQPQQSKPPPQKRPAESTPPIQKKLMTRPDAPVDVNASQASCNKQPAKPKPTPPVNPPQHQVLKSSTGPPKAAPVANQQQKPAPYYPLSSQVRAGASSSTAALASMTASSALVVGSSSGRTKQDLVNQSNKSSQRQRQVMVGVVTPELVALTPPKHAVRKSSVNFVPSPIRQSALPIATRSPLPTGGNLIASVQSSQIARTNSIPKAIATPASSMPVTSVIVGTNNNFNPKPQALSSPPPVRINPINNHGTGSNAASKPEPRISGAKQVTSSNTDVQVVSTSVPVISTCKSIPTGPGQTNCAKQSTDQSHIQNREQAAHSTTSNSPSITTTTSGVSSRSEPVASNEGGNSVKTLNNSTSVAVGSNNVAINKTSSQEAP